MSNLTENTTYSKPAAAVKSMAQAMKTIGGNLPSRKAVDVSRFNNLAGQVKQAPKTSGSSYNLGTVTVPYGGSTRYEAKHPGVDIANKIGTKIPAFTPGKITQVVGGARQGSPGYGNYVIVTDPQGNKHRYSHLNKSFVKVGQDVQKGTVLGTMGNTGQTYSVSGGTGSHLDYRIRDMYNKYVNPLTFIKN